MLKDDFRPSMSLQGTSSFSMVKNGKNLSHDIDTCILLHLHLEDSTVANWSPKALPYS